MLYFSMSLLTSHTMFFSYFSGERQGYVPPPEKNYRPTLFLNKIKTIIMISRDKTMSNPNDGTHNYPFSKLKIVDETFGHSTL